MATVSPSWNYTLRLPRDLRSPGVARATLRAVLDAHDLSQHTATAELLATELLTNAHEHTNHEYALGVLEVGGRLLVAVGDRDRRVPPGFKGGRTRWAQRRVGTGAPARPGLFRVPGCVRVRGVGGPMGREASLGRLRERGRIAGHCSPFFDL
ncbi:ATP-binding protein [Streptomyces ipomoeae]|uniref:ATP-binding protein n=1 Tax=Streptomyces ipomoeae TaxID=103232 RepID=UPI0029B3CF10|nr:ATP-binding protein [Streptomyces ipomoeae]MDX2698105.1 ATP-binding protein [Streptomyces ipomoeae]